jgi:hypothetical protein
MEVQAEWTDSIEKVVKDIGKSCEEYKYINMNAARKATIKYDILMYAVIIIGPITGILSSFHTSSEIITIFSFISGVLSAVIKFSKFENRATTHKSISSKFASLQGNIQRQLSLDREQRQHASKYLDWISRSFDELFSSSPIIVDTVYQKWLRGVTDGSSADVSQPSAQPPTEPSAQPAEQHPVALRSVVVEPNTFNDGNMKYELARLQSN